MPDMWWACPDDAEVDRHKGFAEMPFAAGTYLGG